MSADRTYTLEGGTVKDLNTVLGNLGMGDLKSLLATDPAKFLVMLHKYMELCGQQNGLAETTTTNEGFVTQMRTNDPAELQRLTDMFSQTYAGQSVDVHLARSFPRSGYETVSFTVPAA